jgi:hypothetical protein
VRGGEVHDEWVPVLTPFAGPDGYGAAFMPALGSEVVLFSEGNEGLSLFCLPRFNEDYKPPEEAADGSRVIKSDTPLRLLCDVLLQIIGGQDVLLQAGQQTDVKGQVVKVTAEDQAEVKGQSVSLNTGGEMFRAEGNNLGFRGAAIARRALPAPGALDTPLTIAIRQLLIDVGLAQ